MYNTRNPGKLPNVSYKEKMKTLIIVQFYIIWKGVSLIDLEYCQIAIDTGILRTLYKYYHWCKTT